MRVVGGGRGGGGRLLRTSWLLLLVFEVCGMLLLRCCCLEVGWKLVGRAARLTECVDVRSGVMAGGLSKRLLVVSMEPANQRG